MPSTVTCNAADATVKFFVRYCLTGLDATTGATSASSRQCVVSLPKTLPCAPVTAPVLTSIIVMTSANVRKQFSSTMRTDDKLVVRGTGLGIASGSVVLVFSSTDTMPAVSGTTQRSAPVTSSSPYTSFTVSPNGETYTCSGSRVYAFVRVCNEAVNADAVTRFSCRVSAAFPMVCGNVDGLVVTNVGPSTTRQRITGGQEITIKGHNFGNNTGQYQVEIGGQDCGIVAFVADGKTVRCTTPTLEGGIYTVNVRINGLNNTDAALVYGDAGLSATVSSVAEVDGKAISFNETAADGQTSPNAGTVFIAAANFGRLNIGQLSVSVGGSDCEISSIDSKGIRCKAPQFKNATAKAVVLSVNGQTSKGSGDAILSTGLFLYYGTPAVMPSFIYATPSVAMVNESTTPSLTFNGTYLKAFGVDVNPGQFVVKVGGSVCQFAAADNVTYVCTAPALSAGVQPVDAQVNGKSVAANFGIVYGNPQAVLTSAMPSVTYLDTSMAAIVTLTGMNFGGNLAQLSVKVVNESVPILSVSPTTITVSVPAKTVEQAAEVLVQVNGYTASSVNLVYGQFYSPKVKWVVPDADIQSNSKPVLMVYGSEFGNNAGQVQVQLSGTNGNGTCDIISVADSIIRCTGPSLPQGMYLVTVTVNTKVSTETIRVIYGKPQVPVVNSVIPDKTPLAANSSVSQGITIVGSSFGNNMGQVKVGLSGAGNSTCDITSVSDTQITCVAPNLPAAWYTVNVKVNGQSASASVDVVYGQPLTPMVLSIVGTIAASSNNQTGQKATAIAKDFGNNRGQLSISINNVSATIVDIPSSDSIVFNVPSLPTGSYPVVLAVNGKTGSTVNLVIGDVGSTIAGVKTVPEAVRPWQTPAVTITGTKFGNNIGQVQVTVGKSSCSGVQVADTSITCTAPALESGNQPVVVIINGVVAKAANGTNIIIAYTCPSGFKTSNTSECIVDLNAVADIPPGGIQERRTKSIAVDDIDMPDDDLSDLVLAIIDKATAEASTLVPGTKAYKGAVRKFAAASGSRRTMLETKGTIEVDYIVNFPVGTKPEDITKAMAAVNDGIVSLANTPLFQRLGAVPAKDEIVPAEPKDDDNKKKVAIGVGVGVGVGVPLLIAIVVFLVLRRKQQVVQPGSSA
uniref:IPT/TIG domain-containing protein n=1 Tax=Chlamydomonas leiostraca TaxID=1034604 RepID=A0A7S0R5P6_9CHLO